MNTDNNQFSIVLDKLEEFAALYAGKKTGELLDASKNAPAAVFCHLVKQIYMTGACHALERQWLPYPEHDLPEDIEYVIHDSKGNSYVIPEFVLSKTVKEDYDVVAWLPLPPFNTAEK